MSLGAALREGDRHQPPRSRSGRPRWEFRVRLRPGGDLMRARLALLFGVIIAGWLWLDARAQTNGPIVSGAHKFEKIAEGIYYATASGTMQVGANSPIIVTDSEAVIIDSETSPTAGRALVQDIK